MRAKQRADPSILMIGKEQVPQSMGISRPVDTIITKDGCKRNPSGYHNKLHHIEGAKKRASSSVLFQYG